MSRAGDFLLAKLGVRGIVIVPLDIVPEVEARQVEKKHPEHPGEAVKETWPLPRCAAWDF